ncbi:amidohydrolase [Brevibacillus ginsengisoli]|uniref:amidohydrolase n=1 Tax=Brevibacillus ginsengisoli TaxID=363854 RepID=UPI003CF9E1D3
MSAQPKATIILSSNTVFTSLKDQPEPASIAIVDNKIAAIGNESEMEPFIGEDTKIYHFQDQLIMPGFHDFHLHIMTGSLLKDSVYLFDLHSEEEAAELVREHAESRPEDEWIIGYAWDAGHWDNKPLPHRSSLDRVVPDRPVMLLHYEGHFCWVNSKALEIMCIDRYTENPPFGEIAKDEDGEPTGILYEQAANAVTNIAFQVSREKSKRLFQGFLSYAASLGVTSVNDLYASDTDKLYKDYPIYKECDEQGELTVRVHVYPALDGELGRIKQLRAEYQSSKLQVAGLKQFVDGVVTGHTAYMLEPYSNKPETRGDTTFSEETFKKWITEADREGFRIRLHAIGDGAIRLGLDAFEEARQANGKRDSRHAIEHIEVIHPNDIHRFHELDVIASMQPEHLAAADRSLYVAIIGTEREKHTFPLQSLISTGATLALGSDFPVVPLEPMLEVFRAVTRIDNSGHSDAVWNPSERISLAETLKAYTLNSAYGNFREHELGSLEVGKLADLIVLDRNLFAIPAEEIKEAKVQLTIMDGNVVFEDELIK